MKLRPLSMAALAIALMLLSGLAMTGTVVKAQDSTPADQQSFPVHIRFLNAVTSLDAVDVYINGDESDQRVAEGLAYGAVSDVYEGTAPITGVLVKIKYDPGIDQYLFNTIVPTEAGKEYLIVISDLALIPTEFDQSSLAPGMARARVVHAAAQAPAFDIYASEAGGGIALTDLVPIISDIRYLQVTDGGELAAGSYDVNVTATGTDTVAISVDGMAFDAGQVYTIVAIGTPGDTEKPLTLVPVSVAAN